MEFPTILLGFAVLIFIFWLVNSVYVIKEWERGVVLRLGRMLPEAKGAGGFPRLAGQLHDYTSRKLTNWDKERGQDRAKPDASPIMEPIAHGLTAQQIAEVSAYLGSLE